MELCADAEMAPRLARALFIHRSMKCHTSAVMNRHTSLWTQGVIQQGSIGVFTRLQPVTPTARAGLVGWWPHYRTVTALNGPPFLFPLSIIYLRGG